jgi:crotonobetainyl-CoA:carnitine CoA-transferase CaiB-like acyl-CoA transferase
VKVVGSPVRFSEGSGQLGDRAPGLGEHTDDILAELGFSTDELEALRRARII